MSESKTITSIGLTPFTSFAVVVNQVPLLIERGLPTTAAAWALGLGGVGQVAVAGAAAVPALWSVPSRC